MFPERNYVFKRKGTEKEGEPMSVKHYRRCESVSRSEIGIKPSPFKKQEGFSFFLGGCIEKGTLDADLRTAN